MRDPASMSKLMTLYLLFESMKEGKITKDTVVTATAADQSMSKIYEISNNNIVAGVDYTVSELITMTAVPSSNVATIMLANLLSNHDADAFIQRMNEKSKELGMTNTIWPFQPSKVYIPVITIQTMRPTRQPQEIWRFSSIIS